ASGESKREPPHPYRCPHGPARREDPRGRGQRPSRRGDCRPLRRGQRRPARAHGAERRRGGDDRAARAARPRSPRPPDRARERRVRGARPPRKLAEVGRHRHHDGRRRRVGFADEGARRALRGEGPAARRGAHDPRLGAREMILDERREGGVVSLNAVDPRLRIPAFWRALDRNISLGVKLIVPVVAITLIGTGAMGLIEAQQTNQEVQAKYEIAADGAADAAATAFYNSISHPEGVDSYLTDLARTMPNVQSIWVVNMVLPGQPVISSSNAEDIGRSGLLNPHEVETVEAGLTTHEQLRAGGVDGTLETISPVRGNAYAVIVVTSLAGESGAYRTRIISALIVAVLICAVELAALIALLEGGTLRRIRRIAHVMDLFGKTVEPVRLSEGLEPPGRDELFNLARNLDHKLHDLAEHERADTVVSELGQLALEGVEPVQLTRRALEITREAGDLERCFLVDAGGRISVIEGAGPHDGSNTEARLPIWLGALARAAAQGRRPVLADGLGQGSRYWEASDGAASGAAVFVPLAGTPNPIGVMVGVARPGAQITSVTVTMMEAVATALGESLQRTNAEKARHESEAKSKALHTVSHEI